MKQGPNNTVLNHPRQKKHSPEFQWLKYRGTTNKRGDGVRQQRTKVKGPILVALPHRQESNYRLRRAKEIEPAQRWSITQLGVHKGQQTVGVEWQVKQGKLVTDNRGPDPRKRRHGVTSSITTIRRKESNKETGSDRFYDDNQEKVGKGDMEGQVLVRQSGERSRITDWGEPRIRRFSGRTSETLSWYAIDRTQRDRGDDGEEKLKISSTRFEGEGKDAYWELSPLGRVKANLWAWGTQLSISGPTPPLPPSTYGYFGDHSNGIRYMWIGSLCIDSLGGSGYTIHNNRRMAG